MPERCLLFITSSNRDISARLLHRRLRLRLRLRNLLVAGRRNQHRQIARALCRPHRDRSDGRLRSESARREGEAGLTIWAEERRVLGHVCCRRSFQVCPEVQRRVRHLGGNRSGHKQRHCVLWRVLCERLEKGVTIMGSSRDLSFRLIWLRSVRGTSSNDVGRDIVPSLVS